MLCGFPFPGSVFKNTSNFGPRAQVLGVSSMRIKIDTQSEILCFQSEIRNPLPET